MAQENSNPTEDTQTGQLSIQKIYVKDISFESPNAPQVFLQEWKPNVDIQLGNNATKIGDNVFEVVLTVTSTVKSEENPIYIVEVQQAGIFNIAGFPPPHLEAILATVCPNILFPYARETISDLVVRGGFPQLLLAPVNFDAIYAQQLASRQESTANGDSNPIH